MPTFLDPRRMLAWTLAFALVLPCAAVAAAALPGPALVIKNAACDGYEKGESTGAKKKKSSSTTRVTTVTDSLGCDEGSGLGGFVGAIDAIIDPAVIAMVAITPIACLFGAGSLMFGSRRGLVVIGAALGTLVFVVSINGIVA